MLGPLSRPLFTPSNFVPIYGNAGYENAGVPLGIVGPLRPREAA